jgi:hypothetical protein
MNTTSKEPDGMSAILVSYRGTAAALVGARRFSFLRHVRHLPPGDPIVRVVAHMAFYAQLVLAGDIPIPYTDADGERFARLALIDPDVFDAHVYDDDAELAARFRVPVEQIRTARAELGDPYAG